MHRRWSEHHLFWREFRHTFHTTGAILPSGRSLGQALSRFVAGQHPPRQILEAGPGTGAVTRSIAARLGPEDHLDLVEINPRFAHDLTTRLQHDPRLQAAASRAEVHCCSVEELEGDSRYDLIISGLPLNIFPVELARSILNTFERLLKPGGVFSFFEYVGVRQWKGLLAVGRHGTRQGSTAQLLTEMLQRHELRRDTVWLNVPPAWVHHIRFRPSH